MNNVSNPTAPSLVSSPGAQKRVAIAAAIVAIAHGWPVWQQGVNNWHHDRYSFFPLILIGAALIAWQRRRELAPDDIQWAGGPVPFVSGLFCLMLLAFSVHLNSPWPGALSAVIALRGLLRWGLGVRAAQQFAAVWWFLLLGLPLPLGSDRELVLWMQLQASQTASGVLDLFGYRHDISGVNMMFPGHVFEVEDACSGIQSLYAAVACVALYSALHNRSTPRVLCNIVITGFWVFVTNVVRIVAVCIGVIEWNLPLSHGVGHELLGVIAFVSAMLLSVSADRFLVFLVPLRNLDAEFGSRHGARKSLFRSLQGSVSRLTQFAPSPRMSAVLGSLLIVGFLGVSVWQARKVMAMSGRWFPAYEPVEIDFDSNFLPPQLGEWRQTGFEIVTRDQDDDFGLISRVWSYELHDVNVIFSVDGPYTEWHDISHCYGALGWTCLEEVDHFASEPGYTEFLQEMGGASDDLTRPDNTVSALTRQMYVVFAAFTEDGEPIPPPPLVRWGLGSRFPQLTTAMSRVATEVRRGARDGGSATRKPIYQLQMIYEVDGAITEPEREAGLKLYRQVQEIVLERMQQGHADRTEPPLLTDQ